MSARIGLNKNKPTLHIPDFPLPGSVNPSPTIDSNITGNGPPIDSNVIGNDLPIDSNPYLQTALIALDQGYSPLPPKEDGSKAPHFELIDGEWTWKPYQTTPATREHIQGWYAVPRTGDGLACGVGGLECFEFDCPETHAAFLEAVWVLGLGELVARIRAGYEESSPGGGYHWLYRCPDPTTTKLACRHKIEAEFDDDDRKAIAKAADKGKQHQPIKTLIETKGHGGYIIIAPSNGKVHPTGGTYKLITGGLKTIVTITAEERDQLWNLAETFDEMTEPEKPDPEPKNSRHDDRYPDVDKLPGTDFNERGVIDEALKGSDWTWVYTRKGIQHYRRPGKDHGVSGTWDPNRGKYGTFKNFSTSANLKTGKKTYDLFGLYAALNHGGDLTAAASALAQNGWGRWVDNDGEVKQNPAPKDWVREGRGQATQDSPDSQGKQATSKDSCSASPTDTKEKTKSKPKPEPAPTHADILLKLASSAQLFHSPDQRCFARLRVNGHHENHEIKSTGFRRWLISMFLKKKKKAPSSEALQSAIATLDAKAMFDGPEQEVYVRVADGADAIFLDLGGEAWNAVKVTPDDWEIVADPPVRFIRPKGLCPLPTPVHGGSLESLRKLLTIGDDDWLLFIAWLTQALRPIGPYPVLTLAGEQGSAKSTTAKIIRSFTDPHVAMLRSEPRENRDLMISACNGWLIALDNISYLSDWLSDAICRLATGGGFAIRTNYSDTDETFLDAIRPVVIASIEDVVRRGDLSDRCVTLTLQTIPEDKRRTEAEVWTDVRAVESEIMGAILDVMVGGLRNLPSVKLSRLPRMADFAVWGEAVWRALGKKTGEFLKVYATNRQQASENILEESAVAQILRAMMSTRSKWTGTARELLEELERIADEKVTKSKRWPKNPRALSGQLRRLAPALRTVGIMVDFSKEGHAKTRTITIEVAKDTPPDNAREFASASSLASATEAKPSKTEEMDADANADAKSTADANAGHADANAEAAVAKQKSAADANAGHADANVGDADAKQKPFASARNPGKDGSADGADHADAKKQPVSGATRKFLGHPYARDDKPPF